MKFSHWRMFAVSLAAALFFPVGLAAQLAPPPAPVPPDPPQAPIWFARTGGPGMGQRGGMARVIDIMPGDAGWLGVSIEEVSSERARQEKLSRPEGVYVTNVQDDSPAAKAGVKAHDIITEYNGHAVEGVLQFSRLVRETPPGRSVSLRVWRNDHSETLSAEITRHAGLLESRLPAAGSMNDMMGGMMRNMGPRGFEMFRAFAPHPLLGVNAEEVQGQLGKYFNVPGGRGILVVSVDSGSAAEKAGIKAGDVIYQVAGKPVRTTQQLERALTDNCSANGVSIGLVRKGATLVERAQIQCPQSFGESSSSAATMQ